MVSTPQPLTQPSTPLTCSSGTRSSGTRSSAAIQHIALGLASGFLTWPAVAIAQNSIPVTGGNLTFNNSQIYVPCACEPGSALIIRGETPTSFLIQTSQGNIPLNAVFRTDILPNLSTLAGAEPAIGDTGLLSGSLTFRGFTADGQPGLYSNIPTDLNFTITAGTIATVGPYTRYETDPFTLIRTGTISTPTTFTTVLRTDPVVGVQFQPDGTPAQDQILLGVPLSASDYTAVSDGTVYASNFNAAINGGQVQIPADPGFSSTVPTTIVPPEQVNPVGTNPSIVIVIPDFVTDPTNVPDGTGNFQLNPVLPLLLVVNVFTFESVPSGLWYDPPTAQAFDFTMTPGRQPRGVASRVFPGLSGGQERTSRFTAISGLPKGIDPDNTFTVSVQGVVLGEFTADQTVNFKDYRAQLGDRFQEGGVAEFTISDIGPGVDPTNARAFPVKLDFNTPTASFEMKAKGVETASSQATPVARIMRQPQ